MQELLQQIDLDFYRSVRLLIAHAELEQLRQERPASDGLQTRRRLRLDETAKDVGLTTRCAARLGE